jgi:hypothetical protein
VNFRLEVQPGSNVNIRKKYFLVFLSGEELFEVSQSILFFLARSALRRKYFATA